ncbi:MAG: peptidylprolyl isomerase, partial [Hyphomicrobiaceae bacterium]|nr:peptidylprolyl isomerase [Hyphomicrobiaceae bacterium]
MVKHALRSWALALALLFAAAPVQAANDPANTLVMELRTGKVVIQLMPNLAPKHVARVKELVRAKFYDGIVFHRVID